MKKILMILFVLVVLSGIMNAEIFPEKIELYEGKNNFTAFSDLGYASELVTMYPEIETISYKGSNETIGYVNVFGGIGVDFLIEENKTYEINARRNFKIYIE